MTIVGTPIASASIDAYVSLAEADAYFAARLSGSATWSAASSSDKIAALNEATAKIDAISYQGYKYLSTQDRQFPRKFHVDPNQESPWGVSPRIDAYGYYYQSEVPSEVETACILEALALIEYNSSDDPVDEVALQAAGVASFSLGKLSMSFRGRSRSAAYGLRSTEAYGLLEKYIETSATLI